MYVNPWNNDYYKEEIQAKRREGSAEFHANQSIEGQKIHTYETKMELKSAKVHKEGNGNEFKPRKKKEDWWNSTVYYR